MQWIKGFENSTGSSVHSGLIPEENQDAMNNQNELEKPLRSGNMDYRVQAIFGGLSENITVPQEPGNDGALTPTDNEVLMGPVGGMYMEQEANARLIKRIEADANKYFAAEMGMKKYVVKIIHDFHESGAPFLTRDDEQQGWRRLEDKRYR